MSEVAKESHISRCHDGTPESCNTTSKCSSGKRCVEPCLTYKPTTAPDTDTTFEHNPNTARGHILREAYDIINGERQDVYGKPEDSFALIAQFWNTYLDSMVDLRGTRDDRSFSTIQPRDVAMLMVLFKLARYVRKGDVDSLRDLAGYTGIAGDLS